MANLLGEGTQLCFFSQDPDGAQMLSLETGFDSVRGMLASQAAYTRPTTTKIIGIHATKLHSTTWLALSIAALVGTNTSCTGASQVIQFALTLITRLTLTYFSATSTVVNFASY